MPQLGDKREFGKSKHDNPKHKEGTKHNKGGNQVSHTNNKITSRDQVRLTPEEANFSEYVVYEGLSLANAYLKANPEYTGSNKYRMGSYTAAKPAVRRYMNQLNTARVNNLAKNHNFIYEKYLALLEDEDTDPKLQKSILDSLAKLNGMEVSKSVQLNADLDLQKLSEKELDEELDKLDKLSDMLNSNIDVEIIESDNSIDTINDESAANSNLLKDENDIDSQDEDDSTI